MSFDNLGPQPAPCCILRSAPLAALGDALIASATASLQPSLPTWSFVMGDEGTHLVEFGRRDALGLGRLLGQPIRRRAGPVGDGLVDHPQMPGYAAHIHPVDVHAQRGLPHLRAIPDRLGLRRVLAAAATAIPLAPARRLSSFGLMRCALTPWTCLHVL